MSDRKSHPLYSLWKEMRKRCNSPGSPSYKFYGGRGIQICKRWDDFWVFVSDVSPRPKGCTLDRIDNNGSYSPENVRWATRAEQQRNTRNTILTEMAVKEIRSTKGKDSAMKLAKKYGAAIGTIMNVRSGAGWVKP